MNGNRNWEWEKNEKPFFLSSFFFLFVSFLPFFRLFLSSFLSFFFLESRKWEWREEEFFLFFFSFYFLFLEKQRGINWKKSKEILSIFLVNFLPFFFLKTLLPFSFGERNRKIGRIKKFAPIALKRFCKNTFCFSKTKLLTFRQKRLSFCSK